MVANIAWEPQQKESTKKLFKIKSNSTNSLNLYKQCLAISANGKRDGLFECQFVLFRGISISLFFKFTVLLSKIL
jgi:hypothetical protein